MIVLVIFITMLSFFSLGYKEKQGVFFLQEIKIGQSHTTTQMKVVTPTHPQMLTLINKDT